MPGAGRGACLGNPGVIAHGRAAQALSEADSAVCAEPREGSPIDNMIGGENQRRGEGTIIAGGDCGPCSWLRIRSALSANDMGE